MAKKTRTTIYLIGDAPLVEEFGQVCHESGISIVCKLSGRKAEMRLPKFLKASATIPRTVEFCFELTSSDEDQKKKNLQFLGKRSSPKTIIVSSSVVVTASEQATWIRHPQRLIGMSALPTLLSQKLIELAPTLQTRQAIVNRTHEFFRHIGKEAAIVQDRIGMVMPRILCMLINEAAFALTENIASPQDIDVAMKLGTNYPLGPIEWGDKIGFSNVLNILNALFDDLHEERYRAAPLLKQLATGSKWWGT